MMAEGALETLEGFDAIYFGAVGWPRVPDHVSLWGLRIAICQGFDQYANVRPVRLLPGVESPLRSASAETVDWVVVRENSEGEYSGLGGRNLGGRGPGKEVAIQSALFTEEGCERIMRFAFEMALKRERKKVTSVTKSNAQQYSSVLWPETIEVVVASNLFADILSDLGGALAGSLGVAASANLDPERRRPSMFEPVHGSAPDIAGQGIANPIGAIASAALMLEHLGLEEEAGRVNRAIEATTGAGLLPPDLGGSSTTREVGDAVLTHLSGEPEST